LLVTLGGVAAAMVIALSDSGLRSRPLQEVPLDEAA
jgi:hypothetical protein